ncbi:MAG TPA: DNA polymerase III subunit delta' [Rhizomicrobium sp.]|jgi:DNA polymerase-3 subunit delta'
MAKRVRSEEIEETDRLAGFPHPRGSFRLIGQDAALARAARAIRAGRPPQAWLIAGPPGIGKATLAYRIARYLLRYGATGEGPEDLSVPANDAVSVQVTANSHPGLLVLKRGVNPDTGRMMTVLGVDVIRRLAGFFGMTSGAGGWRIAIVDTADDMNEAAANALLKALEEPPRHSILMLLANAPGRLLPTIRSRCQRLDLRPLSETDLATALHEYLPGTEQRELQALAKLAGGSIGAALALAGEDGLALAKEANTLIETAASPDVPSLMALADKVARIGDGLEMFGGFLAQALADRIRARAATASALQLQRWTEAWEQIGSNFVRADALHLEPRQTILSSARAISALARRSAL